MENKIYEVFLIKFVIKILTIQILMTFCVNRLYAQNVKDKNELELNTKKTVSSKVNSLFDQYCQNFCKLVEVKVDVSEDILSVENLGFEILTNSENVKYYVEKIFIKAQIDERISEKNQIKLKSLLQRNIGYLAGVVDIDFQGYSLPDINDTSSNIAKIKSNLRNKIDNEVRKLFQKFCPNQCILSKVSIDGEGVEKERINEYSEGEIFFSDNKKTAMKVNEVRVEVTLNQNLSELERSNILEILKAKTKFVKPVNIESSIILFPESYNERMKKEEKESEDPYGLEKLRRMLILFRDLAGTKEVISKTQESSSNQMSTDHNLTESSSWYGYLIIFIITMFVGFLIYTKLSNANADSKLMVSGMDQDDDEMIHSEGEDEKEISEEVNNELQEKILYEEIKKEIVEIFIQSPRVAKETFTKMLIEEGVEVTSKYVHLLGKIVGHSMKDDPNLQRNLYDLSEYYHKCSFDFSLDEKMELMTALKIKVTAQEIKVISRTSMEHFEFLNQLDPQQIYKLMEEEKPQIQSIILTQLTRKKRNGVFNMFEGEAKTSLMSEVCKADSIPKEYLRNVALALNKKVKSKPEFDTQSVRSVDIILELLEKTNLEEQKILMSNLSESNGEASRLIKMKLVTIEILPFLKDGHLLELVLGMDPEPLMNFLGGAPDHIRELMLSHVPEELAESWQEELEGRAGVEEQQYRAVEIEIIGKIRSLASSGSINILEVNERIFSRPSEGIAEGDDNALPVSNLVA